jgi:hypothetical protein
MTTRDQSDLILVFWRIGGPAVLADIYAEYKRQHPSDLYVKNRKNRIRNVLQRNCASSKQFRNGDGRNIFFSPSRGVWGLVEEYQQMKEVA